MYESLTRRRGDHQGAGIHDRRPACDPHRGSYRDWLRRHELKAAEAARGTKEGRDAFAALLFDRVSDERNLRIAIDHIDQKGGVAPGPDGRRLADLDDRQRWELARELREEIRSGTYLPGKDRKRQISKGKGRGIRVIRIQNLRDRVVQRAITQVVYPLIEPSFSDVSHGYRPEKGRETALARATVTAGRHGLWTWVTEDIRDAFNQIPRSRLIQVLATRIPSQDILGLIELVSRMETPRGIRQGGSLSPMLLNVYLDHVLDRPWEKAYPDLPMIRVADDILLLCRDRGEAQRAREGLERLLRPAGMPLKGTPESTIRDLGDGESARWLGYDLTRGKDGVEAHLPDDSPCWEKLTEHLRLAHDHPRAPMRAYEGIVGWVGALGPCFEHVDRGKAYARIVEIASGLAFEEVPTREKVEDIWSKAHGRWEGQRTEAGKAGQAGETCSVGRNRLLRKPSSNRRKAPLAGYQTGSTPPGRGPILAPWEPEHEEKNKEEVTPSKPASTARSADPDRPRPPRNSMSECPDASVVGTPPGSKPPVQGARLAPRQDGDEVSAPDPANTARTVDHADAMEGSEPEATPGSVARPGSNVPSRPRSTRSIRARPGHRVRDFRNPRRRGRSAFGGDRNVVENARPPPS